MAHFQIWFYEQRQLLHSSSYCSCHYNRLVFINVQVGKEWKKVLVKQSFAVTKTLKSLSESNDSLILEERKVGIEPTPTAPQAAVLPLNYIRHEIICKARIIKI